MVIWDNDYNPDYSYLSYCKSCKKRSNKEKEKKVDNNRQGNIEYISCPTCGAQNLPGSIFCSSCGKELEKFCLQCGNHITPGARFCPKCEEKL